MKFHDGTDFDADVVVWNLEKILNDKSPQFDPKQAADKFQEGIKLDPDDKSLRHEMLFAQTYAERSPDLLYRIYVKYLPLR